MSPAKRPAKTATQILEMPSLKMAVVYGKAAPDAKAPKTIIRYPIKRR